jgi:hypothetical protein
MHNIPGSLQELRSKVLAGQNSIYVINDMSIYW